MSNRLAFKVHNAGVRPCMTSLQALRSEQARLATRGAIDHVCGYPSRDQWMPDHAKTDDIVQSTTKRGSGDAAHQPCKTSPSTWFGKLQQLRRTPRPRPEMGESGLINSNVSHILGRIPHLRTSRRDGVPR